MIFKFNEVKSSKKANSALDGLMRAYQLAKKKKDTQTMELAELAIVATGGALEQAAYPSDFIFQLIDKAKWQIRRNAAQVTLESKLGYLK